MLNLLDLFSGIGGFSLGLEASGAFRTVAFCEINPWCRALLAKRWPGVMIFHDVRNIGKATILDLPRIDAICGGFPCQDISRAGGRAGLAGERSGLWWEFVRTIRLVGPRIVIVENVAALRDRDLGAVVGAMAEIGYRAEWHCIPASAVGAEHGRDRIWIVAHADGGGELQPQGRIEKGRRRPGDGVAADDADADGARRSGRLQTGTDSVDDRIIGPWLRSAIDAAGAPSRDHWDHQPVLGRGVHGVPHRVDRIRALGNAVYPKIPEVIGVALNRGVATEPERKALA